MGNHDYFTDGDALAGALERHGMKVLRNSGVTITRGEARLHVAGVDDTWTGRHDVTRSLRGRPAGVPTVLLAHDPDLFVEAAAHGVELTLSGHTHGGQIAVPGATEQLNLARLMTRFTAGLFRSNASTLYVSRGLGTTGPPVRLGARPEIAVLELRRAPPHGGPMQELAEELIREASQAG
jgi:predicted MPP superfamily phosphohydrolase